MSLFRSKFVGVALALSWTGSAQALTIEFNSNFSLDNALAIAETTGSSASGSALTTNSVQLQGFDNSLGVLTGAEITFTSGWYLRGYLGDVDWYGQYTSYNDWTGWHGNSNDAAAQGSGQSILSLSLSNPYDWIAASLTYNTRQYGCSDSVYMEQMYSNPTVAGVLEASCYELENINSKVFSGTLDLSNISNIGFFSDPAADLVIELANLKKVNITSCDNNDAGDRCSASIQGSWWGTITTRYTYETVDADITTVPEPTNLALMGLGLAILTLTRRKNAHVNQDQTQHSTLISQG